MTRWLACQVEKSPPRTCVHVVGVLDLDSASTLRGVLRACLADEPTSIVINLAGLAALTTMAVAVLAAVGRRARGWPGTEIILCGATGQPAHLLDQLRGTPLLSHVSVYPTLAGAIAAARAVPSPRAEHRRLLPVAEAPGQARAVVREACRRWGLAAQIGAAELVASELVSNAVVHARTVLDFEVRLRAGALRLSVRDGTRGPTRRRRPGGDTEHGRGLLLVEALAACWGRVPVPGGKIIWACLPVPRPG